MKVSIKLIKLVDSLAFCVLDSSLAKLLENVFSQKQGSPIKGKLCDTSGKWPVKYWRFKSDDQIPTSHGKLCKPLSVN